MNLKNFLTTFEHFDIVAIVLFVFILIATKSPKALRGRIIKDINTAKEYPQLRHIYIKYFRVRAGVNLLGTIAGNEPMYVVNNPFLWNYKLQWPQTLLRISFGILALITGLLFIVSFYILKNTSDLKTLIIFVFITSCMIFILRIVQK